MNKTFLKSVRVSGFLLASGFLFSATQAFAQIPPKYFAADLGAADLSGIASKYPTLFWAALVAIVAFCLGYGIYAFMKREKK